MSPLSNKIREVLDDKETKGQIQDQKSFQNTVIKITQSKISMTSLWGFLHIVNILNL